MHIKATVTDIFTDGFIEVAPWENDEAPGKRRCVASDSTNAKRGDIVELEPAEPWNDPIAKAAYIAPVVFFLLGLLLFRDRAWPDRLAIGAILALLTFVMAWLMNRRARLRRRLEYHVVRILRRKEH